jgi:hypothetical protein
MVWRGFFVMNPWDGKQALENKGEIFHFQQGGKRVLVIGF